MSALKSWPPNVLMISIRTSFVLYIHWLVSIQYRHIYFLVMGIGCELMFDHRFHRIDRWLIIIGFNIYHNNIMKHATRLCNIDCPRFQGHKGHMKVMVELVQDFVLENMCVQYESDQSSLGGLVALRSLWPCPRFQGHKGHMKVSVELVRDFVLENDGVQYESNQNTSWTVIVIISHSDLALYFKVTKVTWRWRLNFSEILS
jgi:hypothetical protein